MSLFPIGMEQDNKDLEISRDGQPWGTAACPLGVYRSKLEVNGSVKLGKQGCAVVQAQKGSMLRLMLGSRHLDILNNSLTRGPAFSVCIGTCQL